MYKTRKHYRGSNFIARIQSRFVPEVPSNFVRPSRIRHDRFSFQKETEVLQIADRKRHAHASARHVIAESSGGEKKERRASLTALWVISCAHTKDNSARDRSDGKGRDRASGTTNLTIPSTLRRWSRRPYYNAAQAGFGSPLGDTRASLLASSTRGTRAITSLRRPINFFYYFLDRCFSPRDRSACPRCVAAIPSMTSCRSFTFCESSPFSKVSMKQALESPAVSGFIP